jgi:hypothetical protein
MEHALELSPDAKQFEANGVIYTLDENMTIARYRLFERYRMEVGFGTTVSSIFGEITEAIQLLDRGFQGELVVSHATYKLHNLLFGIKNGEEKYGPAIWMCALFFNAPGEDVRQFDPELMKVKVQNWEEAGISARFFIYKACSMIADYSRIYEETTRLFSDLNPEGPLSAENRNPADQTSLMRQLSI